MADLLTVKAELMKGRVIWRFDDPVIAAKYDIQLDQPLSKDITVNDGDVWQVSLVDENGTKKAKPKAGKRKEVKIVKLVAKVYEFQEWQKITELSGHWVDPRMLRKLLIWLHEGTNIILIGDKGTGKTTLGYKICEALGWQEPCKVDVQTIKKTTDLFGKESAQKGSTSFVGSSFYNYIERAMIAHEKGIDTHFLVILDEINRVHSHAHESMHGLFDDTRQLTIITTEGSKVVKLPPNLHVIATMNVGSEYIGVFELDDALKDRFAAAKVNRMPAYYEAKKLAIDIGIKEAIAEQIIFVADVLRDKAKAGDVSFSPSYRACRFVAQLIRNGVDLKPAVLDGLCGWYDGDWRVNDKGELEYDEHSEIGKAIAALRAKGLHDIITLAA